MMMPFAAAERRGALGLGCWHRPTRRHASSTVPNKVFSDSKSAEFLAAAGSPSSIPKLNCLPEVFTCLFSWSFFQWRANVGKSTLLNAVLGRRNLLHTSKKPGRTQTLNFYRVGPLLAILLRRVYILFHAKHGLNEVDRMMLSSLDEQCQSSAGLKFTVQGIITKVDTLRDSEITKAIKSIQKDIFDSAPTCLPPIITSALEHPHYGVDQVRLSIQEACGLGKAEMKVFRPP
ncbi:hypothetical protein C8Q78DRAFT_1007495 [Trametes maxima]|nr:hypothetical protein C8Q78DRAFT_1007495 [Trametes maxima]